MTQKELAAMVDGNKDTVRYWERYKSMPFIKDSRLSATLDILRVSAIEMAERFP